ncbi:hypothetical protein CYMTET_19703 [Cymbomonas tetramitiformis]|uniref:Uncharacterized protein n=1 Tax=Cymbomonas tetramitiformis TaxID=36881 RepID=A0AAE0G5J8_9CHLO|nr:hypothetical protein CYMTET_19703 [Cymbomonas tetramitiformis]
MPTGDRRGSEDGAQLQRAKKLLKLSKSANVHEAQLAAKHFASWSQRAGIAENDVQDVELKIPEVRHERVLTEIPTLEFEEIEIQAHNRVNTAAGMSGSDRLGLGLQRDGLRPFAAKRFEELYRGRPGATFMCSSDCDSLSLHELLALGDAETLSLWQDLSLSRSCHPDGSLPELRREIANMYGAAVTSEGILQVSPEEGVYFAMHAMLKKGDTVVIQWYVAVWELPIFLNYNLMV